MFYNTIFFGNFQSFAAVSGVHTIAILYGSSVWRYRVNARKLSAECSLEPRSQSEDKQANCLSKMLPAIFFLKHFASFGLPELNCAALANEATVSEHSHDIFLCHIRSGICRYHVNTRKLSAECSLEIGEKKQG